MSAKSKFRDRENISGFIDEFGFGIGFVFFMSVTFERDGFDKKICAESWNLLRSYMNKVSVRKRFKIPLGAEFHFVDLWERHKSGAWHLHILGHIKGVSTKRLRKLFHHFRRVTKSNVGYVHIVWTYGHDSNGIKWYMAKYLSKEYRLRGVRYVNYSRNWFRRVKGGFSFCWGMASVWRKTCDEICRNFSRTFHFFYNNASYSKVLAVIDSWQHSQYLHASALLNEYFARCFMFPLFEDDLREFGRYWCSHQSPMLEPESRAGEAITCIVAPLPLVSRS